MKQIITVFLVSILFINCGQKQEINTITTLALKQLLSKENIQLLDVRSPEEIAQGSIQTALFVNYFDDDFGTKAIAKLNKDKPVYLYCKSGNRSSKAAKILKEKGFKVYNVLGGYTQWSKEN